MDPLVEVFHRINPKDHSLDGMPVTVFVVACFVVVATALALRFAGRSWRVWYGPAILGVLLWWGGVNIGHSGFKSGNGLLWTFALVVFLIDKLPRTLRAALVPADRDGRR